MSRFCPTKKILGFRVLGLGAGHRALYTYLFIYIYVYILGLYRDDGQENGNYYNGLYSVEGLRFWLRERHSSCKKQT